MAERKIQGVFDLPGMTPVLDPYCLGQRNKDPSTDLVPSDQAIGIEVEVEKGAGLRGMKTALWVAHGDGSLRNNGQEFITDPFPARDAPEALVDLFEGGVKSCSFTPRTSVHIHANCRDLTPTQTLDVVLLYMFFERRLYNFVGRNRIKNIYCVPINETLLISGMLNRRFDTVVVRWKKYTGLNLLPLASKGTIEFRQMHGTANVTKLVTWIRMITSMFTYCAKVGTGDLRKKLSALSTKEELDALGKEVFTHDWELLSKFEDINDVWSAKQAFSADKIDLPKLKLVDFEKSPFLLFQGNN